MDRQKLLIATSNEGKFDEIVHFLQDLPFKFLSINDLDKKIDPPTETGETLEQNAILKAKYYAEKSGLNTLSDDGGLFLEGLNGWPGITSARVGKNDNDRMDTVLKKMKKIKNKKALFIACLAFYNPEDKTVHLTLGETKGEILTKPSMQGRNGFGYDPIFFISDLGKTYAELTIQEKNAISHRGKALIQMKYFLENHYGTRNIVVPVALILKDDKMLMTLRNDPHRVDAHKKWEFPGGAMEYGESLEENILREVKEETGLQVEIIKRTEYIAVEQSEFSSNRYQVYLIPHICKIVGGELHFNDDETLDARWFKLDDVLNQDLLFDNGKTFSKVLPELKQILKNR